MTSPRTNALDWLTHARSLFEPAMRAAVGRLDPFLGRVSSYHLGWCEPDGTPVTSPAGKALRPGLTLLVAEALGDHRPAVPGAVAVELVHNFSLVHDDIIDRDRERRHRPTVWSVWDDTTAILAGDAMLSLAHEVLADEGGPYADPASLALARATREVIRGQARDVEFERRDDVTLAECLAMEADKTGALLAVSASLGAILAGAPRHVVDGCHTFGAELGLAFQIVDDLLGIWGSPQVTGKPVFADLAAGKKTLLVVWSIENGGDAGADLAAWFATHGSRTVVEPQELERAADLIEKAGGREWATAAADSHVATALAALDGLGLDEAAHHTLIDLAHFVTERKL
ncbi:polyprenyl synthetase family protein [Nocardioides sp. BP30]|uniref:polyprenyl synthetase family protein n=1 Tax=Nocardioides sp. BP30 TaxID=3036374 RepID=UPI0024687ED4|nr:polyprenyl synthetase family protein [Nocardioides sp. BP30]WGL53025.1 polyprenyl synthetase family protein [Nocardioides sp. BP30]